MRLTAWALAPVAILWVAAAPARATVRAWLDSNQAAPGDTVELTLEFDGQPSGQPDLGPLNRDFAVLDSNTSTSIEIVNGQATARTQVAVSLSPRHAGRLTVPPIRWSGEQSPALALLVAASAHGSSAQPREVFIETEVGPQQPYVQAAVHVTLRLYTHEALYKPSLTFESGPAAVIRQIGSDQEGSVERDGKPFEVLTRHYLLFPQHSGALRLQGPVLDAEVQGRGRTSFWGGDPFSGPFGVSPLVGALLPPSKPIRVQGDPITLDVRPRPAAAAGSYWLPASAVTLTSTWHPSALEAHVGDPLTMDLSLQAAGLTAAQLPDLTQLIELPSGVRVYPDAPKLSDAARGDGIVGTRTQSIALIAGQPGRFVVPALHLHWWDTRSNEAREAVLPERVLEVLPAAASATASASVPSALASGAQAAETAHPAAGRSTVVSSTGPAGGGASPRRGHLALASPHGFAALQRSPWLWVSAALALAWVATLLAWLRLRRRTPPEAPRASRRATAAEGEPSLSRARTAFRFACRTHDPAGARRHLLAWVRAAWPEPAPMGLNALSRQIGDPQLAHLVRELDRACYTGDPWRGEALAAALTELPHPEEGAADGTAAAGLAPLYPQIDAARGGSL